MTIKEHINYWLKSAEHDLNINTSIEVHPFTDKEFKEKNPFIKEILRTGKKYFEKFKTLIIFKIKS